MPQRGKSLVERGKIKDVGAAVGAIHWMFDHLCVAPMGRPILFHACATRLLPRLRH
jgi:hypothetical protein